MSPDTGPIIDAHHHLWTLHQGSHPWLERQGGQQSLTPDHYARTFAGFEIAATVWIEALAADPLAELAAAEAVRQGTDGRVGAALIGHVPLDAADVADRLAACRAISPAFRGVRDILSPNLARADDLLARPAFREGLHALAAHDLLFEALLTPAQMLEAASLFAGVPDLTVVVEHVGSPHDRSPTGLAQWRAGLEALAALPRVFMKVSALQCLEPNWTDVSLAAILAPIVQQFGAARLCVGTDWPVHDETCPGPEALAALRRLTRDWPGADQRAIFETTARHLYRVP